MIAKYKKNILVRRLITILAVVASALLQTYVIQAFIRPANLLSSGFTGVAILIDRIASLYFHLPGNAGPQYTGGHPLQQEHKHAFYLLFHAAGVPGQLLSQNMQL